MKFGLVLVLMFASSVARGECPERDTPCILQEEALALYRGGNFAGAVEKFKASIAIAPTARAYLGYAQALEGLVKFAQAYEALVEAKHLNDAELATKPDDVDLIGRADRLSYKLAELQAKTATVTISLPTFVKVEDLVSVQRKDEGDIANPLGRPIVVAATKQEMVATLRDGRAITFVVALAPGATGTTVIPVPPPAPPPAQPTIVTRETPVGPPPPRHIGVSAGSMVSAGTLEALGGTSVGGHAMFEVGVANHLDFTARAALAFHLGPSCEGAPSGEFLGSYSYSALIGFRASTDTVYAIAHGGISNYSQKTFVGAGNTCNFRLGHERKVTSFGELAAGIGIRLSRFDIRASVAMYFDIVEPGVILSEMTDESGNVIVIGTIPTASDMGPQFELSISGVLFSR